MSNTFKWCQDKTKLDIFDKPVFCFIRGGNKFWYLNGEHHRENGPALEYANGGKEWYLNGKLHRLNGPACEYVDGTKYWYLNGKRHRVNGPAIEYASGFREWCLNGKIYSESAYWKELKK